MNKEMVVKIDPDGNAYFLYSDDGFLKKLGKIEVTRASSVEWDAKEQKWVVWVVKDSGGSKERMPELYDNRSDAIAAEIVHLNGKLSAGENVETLF